MNPPKKHNEHAAAVSVGVVICAAGSSRRMGGLKKEYRLLPAASALNSGGAGAANLSVLGAAVSAFAAVPAVKTIVIAVPPEAETGEAAARNALPPGLLADSARPRILFAAGGASRRASVHNALLILAAWKPDYVLIHDGARPWVSPALIERVIAAVQKHRAAVPLLPLTETPKETDVPLDAAASSAAVFIKRHLRRPAVGAAQTPQGFAFPEMRAAHARAAAEAPPEQGEYTDDAEIWAAFCGPVAVVPGAVENRKITFPEDLQ